MSAPKIGILNHIFSRLLKYLEKYLDRYFFVLITQGGSFPAANGQCLAQLVELQLPELVAASSTLVVRSTFKGLQVVVFESSNEILYVRSL